MEQNNYGLDLHCEMILDEYRENVESFEVMKDLVIKLLKQSFKENGLIVAAIEGRVKTEQSLAGKLELKGSKYHFLSDITDVIGVRAISFYSDDVDKIAALAENIFIVDWDNSVDKRKMHELDSFGYNSLHYICQIPKNIYYDEAHPEFNELKFELQMRSTLQHMWANMYHDTGYKSGVEVPKEYIRSLNRLSGILELADDEFSRIRTSINDYRRKVNALVADGKFEEVQLNGDTFKSYLNLKPFEKLNKKIAAINQAEIHEATLMPYLEVFRLFNFKTLGDIENLKKEYGDHAYKLAVHQIGGTDLDIISSSVAVQDLCIVFIIINGGGELGLTKLFEILNGPSPYNRQRAAHLMEQASKLAFIHNDNN